MNGEGSQAGSEREEVVEEGVGGGTGARIDDVKREVDERRKYILRSPQPNQDPQVIALGLSEVERGSAKAELPNRRKLERHRGRWRVSGESVHPTGHLCSVFEDNVIEGEALEG